MGERPICLGLREGTGCHSNQRAETEQPRTKRPKQRMPIAPRRPQDPRDAPPLMPSRSASTPAAPPARHGGGEARGRKRGGLLSHSLPRSSSAVTAGPAPSAFQSAVGAAPPSSRICRRGAASSLPCPVILLQISSALSILFSYIFPILKISPPPLPFSPAVTGNGCYV